MKNQPAIPTTIDEYIADFPRPVQAVLKRVRATIKKAVPGAEEAISYRIPTFKLHGRYVIYFAGWKAHYSLYPADKHLVAEFGDRLAPYEVNGKGTIRFPLDAPVPVELIADIARFRAQEVEGAAMLFGSTRKAAGKKTTAKKAAAKSATATPSSASKARARPFSRPVVAAIDASKIVGIRAGSGTEHRFIGIWAVVVDGRVFARSWTLTPGGWYHTLREDPVGVLQVGERQLKVRALRVRGSRLISAIEKAYAAKYPTPASQKYVRGFRTAKRRATTTEFVPR